MRPISVLEFWVSPYCSTIREVNWWADFLEKRGCQQYFEPPAVILFLLNLNVFELYFFFFWDNIDRSQGLRNERVGIQDLQHLQKGLTFVLIRLVAEVNSYVFYVIKKKKYQPIIVWYKGFFKLSINVFNHKSEMK